MSFRRVIVVGLAVALLGAVTADAAAPRKKRYVRPAPLRHGTPWNDRARPRVNEHPGRPPWARPGDCLNNEGYGRFTPCVDTPPPN